MSELAGDPSEVPSRAELISQAVNGDMVRIITNQPPEPLLWAKRLEIARRILAWLTATSAGVAIATAFTTGYPVVAVVLVVTVSLALIYLATWATTIVYAHRSRVELFRKYGVAPNRDGVFELVRAVEPHEDMAATREMLRVYAADSSASPDLVRA